MTRKTDAGSGSGNGTARSAARRPNPAAPDLANASAAGERSLLAIAHLHSRLLKNALTVNAQLLDFARSRITEDIRTSESMACCGSMPEAMDVMTGFYRRAIEEYASETAELMRLSQRAMTQMVDEVQTEAKAEAEALANTATAVRPTL